MVHSLKEFGFNVPELSEQLFLQPGRIVRMGIEPNRLEILTEISGCNFRECYERRLDAVIDGIPVKLIRLSDLKINKQASGRTKDLADLEYLP